MTIAGNVLTTVRAEIPIIVVIYLENTSVPENLALANFVFSLDVDSCPRQICSDMPARLRSRIRPRPSSFLDGGDRGDGSRTTWGQEWPQDTPAPPTAIQKYQGSRYQSTTSRTCFERGLQPLGFPQGYPDGDTTARPLDSNNSMGYLTSVSMKYGIAISSKCIDKLYRPSVCATCALDQCFIIKEY